MKNKILIYDDNCPLCSWYSYLFVKFKLLPADGRKPFSTLDAAMLQAIDFNRSRNEIPLLDTATGNTLYGIDALLDLLGQKCKPVKQVGQLKFVNYLLKKIYKFISYNRKMIVAVKCGDGKIDCSPDINYLYRYAFIVGFLLINTLLLTPLHKTLVLSIPSFHISLLQLQMAHNIFVLGNCLLAATQKKQTAAEYLGQVSMLALLCLLLVLPIYGLYSIVSLPAFFAYSYFFVLSIFIYREYIRRMQYFNFLERSSWLAGINLACMTAFVLFILQHF